MGSIITEVAVLEIHIDKKAVASIKPKITFRISDPIRNDIEGQFVCEIPFFNSNSNQKTSQIKKNIFMSKSSSGCRQLHASSKGKK